MLTGELVGAQKDFGANQAVFRFCFLVEAGARNPLLARKIICG
jgi:hypothetical protein